MYYLKRGICWLSVSSKFLFELNFALKRTIYAPAYSLTKCLNSFNLKLGIISKQAKKIIYVFTLNQKSHNVPQFIVNAHVLIFLSPPKMAYVPITNNTWQVVPNVSSILSSLCYPKYNLEFITTWSLLAQKLWEKILLFLYFYRGV